LASLPRATAQISRHVLPCTKTGAHGKNETDL